jgi:molecular chaperone Hsp33
MDLLVKGMAKGEPLLVVGLRSTGIAERARTIHATLPTASAALGRTLSGAALLSSFLKEGQRVMIQIAGDGPLRGIVAESDWLGRVRGYVRRPFVHLGPKDGKLDVGRAVGRGTLTVLKDLGLREYYRGTVPLSTGEIASDIAYYLSASEQIPAAVSLGVYVEPDNSVTASGGFLVHALPGCRLDLLEELEDRLRKVRTVTEMVREGIPPKMMMEEAVGRQVDVREEKEVTYFCPCTRERVMDALVALGPGDLDSMAHEEKASTVRCEFCHTVYVVSREELAFLAKEAAAKE